MMGINILNYNYIRNTNQDRNMKALVGLKRNLWLGKVLISIVVIIKTSKK